MLVVAKLRSIGTSVAETALGLVRELDRSLAEGSVVNARDAARDSRRRRAMAKLLEAERTDVRKLA